MFEKLEGVWLRIKNQEQAAMVDLYDALAKPMFSLSLKILNDRWEAEEVIQDVFSNLWNKPNSFSPDKGKLSTWVLTLTRNKSIDRYRSRKRRKDTAPLEDATLENRPDSKAVDSVKKAIETEEHEALQRAFEKLPAEQRTVLEYSYFKGLSHSEIAKLTTLSIGTVKSRIRLGLNRLRSIFPDTR